MALNMQPPLSSPSAEETVIEVQSSPVDADASPSGTGGIVRSLSQWWSAQSQSMYSALPITGSDANAANTPSAAATTSPNPAPSPSLLKAGLVLDEESGANTCRWWFLLLLLISVFLSLYYRHILNIKGESLYDNGGVEPLLRDDGWWWPSHTQQHATWQPRGCFMANAYSAKHIQKCFPAPDTATIIGDSNMRNLFVGMASKLDASSPIITEPPAKAHQNLSMPVHGGNPETGHLDFLWDPYLNATNARLLLEELRPKLVVLSAGSWFLKNLPEPVAFLQFKSSWNKWMDAVEALPALSSTRILVLPISSVVPQRLSEPRKAITNQKIAYFNEYLEQLVASMQSSLAKKEASDRLFYVRSYFQVFDGAMDDSFDGLHFERGIYRTAADLLLNIQCNRQVLNAQNPMGVTCNVSYPTANWKQMFVFAMLILFGPLSWLGNQAYPDRMPTWLLSLENAKRITSLLACILLFFAADRTSLMMKQQKHFDGSTFLLLIALTLVGGFATLEKNKDSSFLNRHQTDEWKGWMQIVILIYHYTAGSSVMEIYNVMRVLVASYLFMTGFGHFIYFYKKNDFSMFRVAKVLVRLNLLTAVLSYTMNSTYQSYYFSPLVTLWFFVIYAVMGLKSSWNQRDGFLLGKIVVAGILSGLLSQSLNVFSVLVNLVALTTGSVWNAHEWFFRYTLDRYIVLAGMIFAFLTLRLQQPSWERLLVRLTKPALLMSAFGMLWYFWFQWTRKDKFEYNVHHPYVCIVPVFAFVLLRNSTEAARKTTSRLYTFVGKISLETFIAQFHIWLALDTKGLLVVFPGSWWLNLFLTSCTFFYVSHTLARVTGELSDWLVGTKSQVHKRIVVAGAVLVLFNYAPF